VFTPEHLETDVLVIGAGGAGMYAAIAAARSGADVLLLDRDAIGRGGATVMAQLSVAAALALEEPDDWQTHVEDTLSAGRGICQEDLTEMLCRQSPDRVLELDAWRIGWARSEGRLSQIKTPGHSRARCCYVDTGSTGAALTAAMRRQVARMDGIRRVGNIVVTDLVVRDGEAAGAVGFDLQSTQPVTLAAGAVVLATGGLTRIYRRTTASANMAGDGFAMALAAGAELVDMEFVQFFPIGHLAPRMVGLDPVMWDAFRYKLGGRLRNADDEDFLENYGNKDGGNYQTPRDLATMAILGEIAAGRGSPNGGVWLDFSHISEDRMRAAFDWAMDGLAENGIDLTRQQVEVAPIAHYHLGGVRVDGTLESTLPGLFAAGEAVGCAHGANRLSGNALPEALVFGEVAGRTAAGRALGRRNGSGRGDSWQPAAAADAVDTIRARAAGGRGASGPKPVALMKELRALMWDDVGPIRDAAGLGRARRRITDMRDSDLPAATVRDDAAYNVALAEWFQLRGALAAAEAVAVAALARTESRGAHQRADHPDTAPKLAVNQRLWCDADGLTTAFGAGPGKRNTPSSSTGAPMEVA
jgi:succinate dehydrogenase/fumarate reductase flavoprotein subunit